MEAVVILAVSPRSAFKPLNFFRMKRLVPFLGVIFFCHLSLIAQDLAKKETTHAHKTASLLNTLNNVEPSFPGGYDSMYTFIQHHFVYPSKAIENNIQGKVLVTFVVGANGEVSNVHLSQSMENCPECNQAAIDVVQKFPRWSPAKVKGKLVDATFNLPITLELEEEYEGGD